jgi:hypothetical protein
MKIEEDDEDSTEGEEDDSDIEAQLRQLNERRRKAYFSHT